MVLDRARNILEELEQRHHLSESDAKAIIREPKVIQGSLFAQAHDPILDSVREVDLSRIDPADLLEEVKRWQRELGKS